MSEETNKKGSQSVKLALAAIVALGSLSLAGYQYSRTRDLTLPYSAGFNQQLARSAITTRQTPSEPNYVETDEGRQLLWAIGPHNLETGHWFDVTDSPLKPNGYEFGIGKDTIPAIDQPKFVAIDEREKLSKYRIGDKTPVIGYVNNGEAKAYPIQIMDRHELVNDLVGGKPVTVGW